MPQILSSFLFYIKKPIQNHTVMEYVKQDLNPENKRTNPIAITIVGHNLLSNKFGQYIAIKYLAKLSNPTCMDRNFKLSKHYPYSESNYLFTVIKIS